MTARVPAGDIGRLLTGTCDGVDSLATVTALEAHVWRPGVAAVLAVRQGIALALRKRHAHRVRKSPGPRFTKSYPAGCLRPVTRTLTRRMGLRVR